MESSTILMDPDFTNREIREMFQDVHDALNRIEEQTKKTNGSVADLNRWRYIMMGGMGVLTTVIVPILVWALYSIVNINQTVHQAVDQALQAYDIKTTKTN